MRIALAGAGGTGKGTLGKMIAEHLNVPFIPSHIKETGQTMGLIDSYKSNVPWSKQMAFQWAILMGQIYQERSLTMAGQSFVCERSTFDYIPYFLNRDFEDQDYLNTARNWGRSKYDALIFLPYEFESPDTETNTWRERDPEEQQRTSNMIADEILRYYRGKLLTVTGTVEERFKQYLQFYERSLKDFYKVG